MFIILALGFFLISRHRRFLADDQKAELVTLVHFRSFFGESFYGLLWGGIK